MGGVRKTVKHPYGYDHTDAFTCLEYLSPFLVFSVLYMGGYSPQGGEEKKEVKAYAHPYRKYDYGITGGGAAFEPAELCAEHGVDYSQGRAEHGLKHHTCRGHGYRHGHGEKRLIERAQPALFVGYQRKQYGHYQRYGDVYARYDEGIQYGLFEIVAPEYVFIVIQPRKARDVSLLVDYAEAVYYGLYKGIIDEQHGKYKNRRQKQRNFNAPACLGPV